MKLANKTTGIRVTDAPDAQKYTYASLIWEMFSGKRFDADGLLKAFEIRERMHAPSGEELPDIELNSELTRFLREVIDSHDWPVHADIVEFIKDVREADK